MDSGTIGDIGSVECKSGVGVGFFGIRSRTCIFSRRCTADKPGSTLAYRSNDPHNSKDVNRIIIQGFCLYSCCFVNFRQVCLPSLELLFARSIIMSIRTFSHGSGPITSRIASIIGVSVRRSWLSMYSKPHFVNEPSVQYPIPIWDQNKINANQNYSQHMQRTHLKEKGSRKPYKTSNPSFQSEYL